MKLFHKSWVFLIAMGLVICLAVQTGGVLAGELQSDTKIIASELDDTSYGDDLTFTSDGVEGDPDGTLDAWGGRTSELQGLIDSEDAFNVDDIILAEFLVRMMSWFCLY